MEKWTKTFLERLEQELAPYRLEGYYIEAEGENPHLLSQVFEAGKEFRFPVIVDLAVFQMEDNSSLLQIYTSIERNVQAEEALLERINRINLQIPLGAFGFFEQQQELYHKYGLRLKEPDNMEEFVYDIFDIVQIVLNISGNCYKELMEIDITKEGE